MEVVALFLQKEAIKRVAKRAAPDECDLFGRSAYNRYYYATFLCVRNVLAKLDDSWAALPHKDYPALLKGTIKDKIRKCMKRANKLDDNELVTRCYRANHAASELAKLMTISYAIRVIADYRPDIAVDFRTGHRFKLHSVEITEAHQWPSQAHIWAGTIAAAWGEIQIHDR